MFNLKQDNKGKYIVILAIFVVMIIIGVLGLIKFFPQEKEQVVVDVNLLKDKDYIDNLRKNDSVEVKNDLTKIYNSKEKKVLIKDAADKTLLDAQLLSDYNKMVPAGEDVLVAEMLLNDWNKRNTVFDILNFYDREKDYAETAKRFTLKYATEEKTVKDCIDIPGYDELQHCTEEQVPNWETAVEFTKLSELPNKNIKIGIFTDTTLNEKVEWLPTIAGFALYEWAAYDVTELDSLEYDTVYGRANSLVMIDATHFILASEGTSSDGYITTFSIDGSYNITELHSIEHDTVWGQYNSLVMIDATHFILAYMGTDSDGYITTFSIDGEYNITKINSIEHDTVWGFYNSLVMIDATHFILAYMGESLDGYITTFSIDGSYNITKLHSIEHDIFYGYCNSLVKIDATHFILAYAADGDDGYIKTFSIDGEYNITELHSLEHDIVYAYENSLVMIDATHFILAYAGSGSVGYIKTFSIDGEYNITEINSLKHDIVEGIYNSLIKIDATHFILAYTGLDDDGYIKIFKIDGSYKIIELNSLEHDAVQGTYNSLVMIDATHFILAYAGETQHGYIKTFSVGPDLTVADSWWDSSWKNRMKIVFDTTTSASSTSLTNFPLGVNLTAARINYDDTLNSGEDIRFVAADNATALDYEIENWDEAATSTVWVEVPEVVVASSTQHIWMYYNNTGASDNSTTTGVWDDNYLAVWHLDESPANGGTHADSTKNGNTATFTDTDGDSDTSVDGVMDGADDFAGDADYLDGGNNIIPTTDFTVLAWARPDVLTASNYNGIVSQYAASQSGRFFYGAYNGSYYFRLGAGAAAAGSALTAGQTRMFSIKRSGSAISAWLDDKTDMKASDATTVYQSANTQVAAIGTSLYWNGMVDEVRISNTARSDDWIMFAYCNMYESCMTYNTPESSNATPSISEVIDSPDPIGVGAVVSFSVDWADADLSAQGDGEMVKAFICKTNEFTTSTPACTGGAWAQSDVYTNRDPETEVNYTTVAGDKGNTRNYYAYVCDDEGACGGPTAGTFTVANQVPDAPTGLLVEGMEVRQAINITDTTPEFSAVYKDSNDEGDVAEKYCVEVDTQADFAGTDMWISDSASCYTGTALGTNIAEGKRSENLTYDGTSLSIDGTTYYWRIWFWDGEERSATSTTGWFKMADQSAGGGVRMQGGRLNGGVRLE